MIVTLDPHLPQRRISRKKSGIAAPRDERFDRVTHSARPVLVVADGEIEARAVQHFRVFFEVGIRTHPDLETLAFGPLDKRQLPIRPTGRSGVARQMVDLDVADVCSVLRIGRARPRHATTLARGLIQVARRHRTLHGNVRATGVQVRSTKIVVGMPCIRRQRENDARVGRRTYDEERTIAPHLSLDVDLHDDLVVARPPGRVDVQHESDGPVAPLRGSIPRRLVLVCSHCVRPKHHVASRADPCHLNAHRPPS